MIDEEEAFRAAIIADPDEITVRLVYADWLDEHGRGFHAATLRQQVTSPANKYNYSPKARIEHRRWSQHLRELIGQDFPKSVRPELVWSEHGWSTLESLVHTHTKINSLGVVIRHGCIEGVEIEPRHLKYLPALVRKHPIKYVHVTNGHAREGFWWHQREEHAHPEYSIRIRLRDGAISTEVAKILIKDGIQFDVAPHYVIFRFANCMVGAEIVGKCIMAWAKTATPIHYDKRTKQWISSS